MNELSKYDHKKAWGKINRDRLSAVMKHGGASILDIGCASGDYVRYLNANGRQARGCDIETRAEWNGGAEFFTADADNLALPPESVDTIICFEVLEHLEHPAEALRAMRAICRRNIIASVPNCAQRLALPEAGLNFNHYIDRTHRNFWTPESFAAAVADAGFKIEEVKLINQVHPEALFFGNLLRLGPLARAAAALFDALPWIRRDFMTTLVIASK
jgi:2-polyprenyl-3-methyl-5-hydroxy-6-metoxy-1,4-benzoquinol methylase